ncbi:NAD(P)/FAD-dependent oxidoreductase [Streptomyces griseorubiginosus]|uniref:NAD(P)/FAD-dependent oxidoreductase n=1 Tax=Streptomyces griseorubiginosus TaxID=67304 RepID=UPI00365E21E2
MNDIETDVVIAGAGITGLLLSVKLARVGLRVLLVEHSKIGCGASSRNEGWLHSGTYHAAAIPDFDTAIRVARKCLYGSSQIRRIAPEALYAADESAVALTKDPHRSSEAEARWREAGVPFRRSDLSALRRKLPSIDLIRAHRAYYVDDIGFDARILYRRLLAEAKLRGVGVLVENRLVFASGGGICCIDEKRDRVRTIQPQKIVLAAGRETGRMARDLGCEIPVRLWKSHILYGPAVVDRPVFWLDSLEAAVMHHPPSLNVVGLTNDAYEVYDTGTAVKEERVDLLFDALARTAIPGTDLTHFSAYACIKVDIGEGGAPLSVEADIRQLAEDVYCVLPGKLTEAPYVTDRLVHRICRDLPSADVAMRPWDEASIE